MQGEFSLTVGGRAYCGVTDVYRNTGKRLSFYICNDAADTEEGIRSRTTSFFFRISHFSYQDNIITILPGKSTGTQHRPQDVVDRYTPEISPDDFLLVELCITISEEQPGLSGDAFEKLVDADAFFCNGHLLMPLLESPCG
ncbi:hypothetical protein [Chitinophaga nivalis]|uniref:Uncharacterized protein n=1 Tax=Chitinophaga nivalis TaxID=2991709 RepID=A0ABT3IGK0_9BACT|nr:hypothetical protein [Chitinophaga nivalis]MCW3483063.1 hypothetical protein [Chitinophaga nivalis]